MNIFKKADKILASFGNMRAMQRTHVDTFTENKIINIKGQKIAESDDGEFWVDFQELAGYTFLNTKIISKTNIKTLKGGKLLVKEVNNTLKINSDNTEIESDYSNVSNRWITSVDFILNEKEVKLFKEKLFDELEFQFKKTNLKFKVI